MRTRALPDLTQIHPNVIKSDPKYVWPEWTKTESEHKHLQRWYVINYSTAAMIKKAA